MEKEKLLVQTGDIGGFIVLAVHGIGQYIVQKLHLIDRMCENNRFLGDQMQIRH